MSKYPTMCPTSALHVGRIDIHTSYDGDMISKNEQTILQPIVFKAKFICQCYIR